MTSRLSFAFLGLSITSSWGNGHATTYRSLLRALAARGHQLTFFERHAPWYADNADLPAPGYCEVVQYDSLAELERQRAAIAAADVVVLGSYVPDGRNVLELVLEHARGVRAFYDIDTPVTLAALERDDCEYLSRQLVPELDLYLSFAGGPVLETLRERYGARRAEPLYCSVDPELYSPVAAPPAWDLGYLGTYSADRQPAVEQLLVDVARRAYHRAFVLAGAQYPDTWSLPRNIERITHVAPSQHRDFYARQRFTLNLTRKDMLNAGYSPSVRLFEAAACGVPIISDAWPGLAQTFEPGRELLLAENTEQVLGYLALPNGERTAIGARARERVLAEHTGAVRAAALERYLGGAPTQPRDVSTSRILEQGAC